MRITRSISGQNNTETRRSQTSSKALATRCANCPTGIAGEDVVKRKERMKKIEQIPSQICTRMMGKSVRGHRAYMKQKRSIQLQQLNNNGLHISRTRMWTYSTPRSASLPPRRSVVASCQLGVRNISHALGSSLDAAG